MKKLGIISGSGDLPFLLAKSVADHGMEPIVVQITQEMSPELGKIVNHIHPIGIGQIRKIIKLFLDSGVDEAAIIGKIEKSILLNPLQLDTAAIRILSSLSNKGDRTIMMAAINYFERKGIKIIDQTLYLKNLLPPTGVLTKRKPTGPQWKDIKYGIELARQVASIDIGQTVVVKNMIPIAIEAIEGTDSTIERGGALGGKGIVVAKATSSDHDFRVDVPTVGERTLKLLHRANGSVLAVEAGRTFLLRGHQLSQIADQLKISLVAVN
tara:strand:- start:32 stop:835 length:804 start_codon:yes stop_codon:yes gene_type:complete